MLTTIMYHYVRDLKHSRYPRIKGLDVALFREQVAYLKKHYTCVSVDDVVDAARAGAPLPENAALLTFDDGYSDHFDFVFPILKKEKISGAFFPPVSAVREHKVLDVNKIHFVLAGTPEEKIETLLGEVRNAVERAREEFGLKSFEALWTEYAFPNRFDSAEVSFIKRLLQFVLPEALRSRIATELFEKVTGVDESIFSRELYLSEEQMACMIDGGMHFGCHGVGHYWLGSLSAEKQKSEIEDAFGFLDELPKQNCRSIAYPFGDYNAETLAILKSVGCDVGFTTRVGRGFEDGFSRDALLTLPRFDTNDLPKDRNAKFEEKGR
ncbi:MAG: polysaccharide deacetylase family protein [Candidatus Spyradosoma sp.]